MHYNNSYNALNAPIYSRSGDPCAHDAKETLEVNTPKNSLFLFYRNALERNWEQNSQIVKICK